MEGRKTAVLLHDCSFSFTKFRARSDIINIPHVHPAFLALSTTIITAIACGKSENSRFIFTKQDRPFLVSSPASRLFCWFSYISAIEITELAAIKCDTLQIYSLTDRSQRQVNNFWAILSHCDHVFAMYLTAAMWYFIGRKLISIIRIQINERSFCIEPHV